MAKETLRFVLSNKLLMAHTSNMLTNRNHGYKIYRASVPNICFRSNILAGRHNASEVSVEAESPPPPPKRKE